MLQPEKPMRKNNRFRNKAKTIFFQRIPNKILTEPITFLQDVNFSP